MLCVTGNTVLLQRSYGPGFLSVRPVFLVMCVTWEVVFLEHSYGPGFLSVRPVFYHVARFWERSFVRAFLMDRVLYCCRKHGL